MRNIVYTKQYLKDLDKLRKSKKFDEDELDKVIEKLANDIKLDKKYKDHKLQGELSGFRDCHIKNDLVLLYYKTQTNELKILTLSRLGSHAQVLPGF
ncbi:MAG: type II toxin-antitoxin system mRNA interferase toxin, RelE/StbE family [Bacteroidales bacterium]|nr:type II toxin-antitoxin system mRNA interferase toxin, RelE/StbE family [Bacteroidales bacterium]